MKNDFDILQSIESSFYISKSDPDQQKEEGYKVIESQSEGTNDLFIVLEKSTEDL